MSCSIFLILHFDSHNSTRKMSMFSVLSRLWGQQVRRKWGVESVCEQHKLELDLQGNMKHPLANTHFKDFTIRTV